MNKIFIFPAIILPKYFSDLHDWLFFSWHSLAFIQCSKKKCHFSKAWGRQPHTLIKPQARSGPSKGLRAPSSYSTVLSLILWTAMLLWTSDSWLHAQILSETAVTHWSFADIHCRIEVKFNIPSIFSIEKQAHFSCVTASAVNIFNNINYWLQHFHDLEKHTASSR